MGVSESFILKMCGSALFMVILVVVLVEYAPGFLARRRQHKMDRWRNDLVDVKKEIEEVERKILDRCALQNEKDFQEVLRSFEGSVGVGYIPRYGRPGSGVNTSQARKMSCSPRVLCPADMDRLTELIQRKKSLERRLGLRRS